MAKQFILAVPNFSEGRDQEVINKVADVIRNKEGIKLVTCEPEHDFNRTVLTVVGEPQPLKEAMIEMAGVTYANVDMTKQKGSHPRIGAQDTIPLFPLLNIELDEVKAMAEDIGQAIFDQYQVPVYFSGENARTEAKKSISNIRKGQYEGLKSLLEDKSHPDYDQRKPDLSVDGKLDPEKGATIVSADKEGLTAYNVFLDTEDVQVAKKIAKALRGPSGGFTTIRSVGIKFPERSGVVVSMNLFDCGLTPVYRAFDFVKNEAQGLGVRVTGSELVGPIKLDYIINSLEHYLQLEGFNREQIIEHHLLDQ